MLGYIDIMKTYLSLQPVTIQTGLVQLSKDQAKGRIHNLKFIESDVYQLINPINFKAGEVFGFDGQIPKSMVNAVDTEEQPTKKKAKKADV